MRVEPTRDEVLLRRAHAIFLRYGASEGLNKTATDLPSRSSATPAFVSRPKSARSPS